MTTRTRQSLIRLLRVAANPSGAAEGDLWWDTATKKVRVHNGTAAADVSSGTSTTTAVAVDANPDPLLIKHGQDIPWTGAVGGAKAIHDQIFDGWVVNAFGYDSKVFDPAQTVTKAQIDTELAAFPSGMKKATHNFLRLIFNVPLNWFNDTQWTAIVANATSVASSLAASGKQFDGIFIDTEYYGTGQDPWDFGTSTTPWTFSATLGATPNQTAVAARAKVIQRGKAVMDAFCAAWPTITVMTTYGPWVSETLSNGALAAIPGFNDVAWANELMGCFIYGLVQSTYTNTQARVIDGGELYVCRTPEHFRIFREWQKVGFARSGTVIIPSGEEQAYMNAISTSVGVYDKDSLNAFATQPDARVGELVTEGLKSADQYAWLYTEVNEWGASQSGKTAVPNSLRDAVRLGAREALRDEKVRSVVDKQIVSTDTTNLREWRDSLNNLLAFVDSFGRISEGGRRVSYLTSRLTTAATTTSTTYSSTGLAVALVTGHVYRFRMFGTYRTVATTTGIGFRLDFNGGTGVGQIWYTTSIYGAATNASTQTRTTHFANQQPNLTTAVVAANTDYFWEIEGQIAPVASGNLTLQFVTEVAASTATVNIGSIMEARELA